MNTTAEKIKQLRVRSGLKQGEVADQLKVSRPTYISIESGKRQPTIIELKQITAITGSSLEELICDTLQVPSGDFGMEKFKQIILNCLRYGGDSSDGKITKTKLAKLVYLADFAWFYRSLKPMSGLSYRRLPMGPVTDQYFRAIDELYEAGAISIEKHGMAFMIQATEESAPAKQLAKDEIALIKEVAAKWKDKNTQDVVDFTHKQLPWRICRPGELIPYELITQEEPGNVF